MLIMLVYINQIKFVDVPVDTLIDMGMIHICIAINIALHFNFLFSSTFFDISNFIFAIFSSFNNYVYIYIYMVKKQF